MFSIATIDNRKVQNASLRSKLSLSDGYCQHYTARVKAEQKSSCKVQNYKSKLCSTKVDGQAITNMTTNALVCGDRQCIAKVGHISEPQNLHVL